MSEPFPFAPETRILEALESDDRVIEAFRRLGLKCLDSRGELCAAVEVETLRDASLYHQVPLKKILEELNRLGVVRRAQGEGAGGGAAP
jgi:hypothetical protein